MKITNSLYIIQYIVIYWCTIYYYYCVNCINICKIYYSIYL